MIVALLTTVLLGLGAVVLDIGALYQERRTLQNSADAAALAVAKDCSSTTGCGSYATTASTYVNNNADDGTSNVDETCGSVDPLPACSAAPSSVPSGVDYVRVGTSTRTSDGGTIVPYALARIWGDTGGTVHASAVVAWGAPTGLTGALPLTVGLCEWSAFTQDGTVYDPISPLPSSEYTLYFHGPNEPISTGGCTTNGPSGAQMPGGFSWLSPTNGCYTTSSDGWFAGSTGLAPPNSCPASAIAALIGHVIFLPVFDSTNGLTGNNAQYHIVQYAAFVLTGYSIVGQYKHVSLITGQYPCRGNDACISGYFVQDTDTSATGIGGVDGGVIVYKFYS